MGRAAKARLVALLVRMATALLDPPIQPHPDEARVWITDWKHVNRSTLVGIFTATLTASGLVIVGCMLHQGRIADSPYWIALPGAAQLDGDGAAKRTPEGKIMYKTVIRFASRIAYDRFQGAVLGELKRLGHI
jgi:hypothetical protein